MRLHLKAGLLATALCAVASPALAHGEEILLVAFVAAGALAGLIGGVATAALRFRVLVGLATTIGVVAIGVLIVLTEFPGPGYPLRDLIAAMLASLSLLVGPPLVVVFLITFAAVSFVRARREYKTRK